ncbi:MAG: M20/M25/M40 family metallo-hydrolase [Paracoccaceae bacterium]|nr:M20/M25/M40 family metallo-hydrolase [Paracoccaceae bacterium]
MKYLNELVKAQVEGEVAIQNIIGNSLQECGCQVDYFDYTPSQVAVKGEFSIYDPITEYPRRTLIAKALGDPALPSLLIFAHPDSEPIKDIDKWNFDPFSAIEKKGRLFGWGIADDLAGCACAVLAMQSVLSKKSEKFGSVTFASTPSKKYARGVSAILHNGLTADASLYLHPAESGKGMREIKAVASGQIEFTISVLGSAPDTTEPGHTAFSHLGINPIDKAILLVNALYQLNKLRNVRIKHDAIHALVGRSTNIHISRIVSNEEDRLSRLNERCIIGGAISFPPGESIAEVKNEVEKTIKIASENDAWLNLNHPEISWISGVTGGEVDKRSPFYDVVSSAITNITGECPHVNPMHTSSDIRNPIVEAGIPCLGFGCLSGNLSQNNKIDEWIDIKDFSRMVDVTSEIIKDWCSGEQKIRPHGHF